MALSERLTKPAQQSTAPADIVCVGNAWFPDAPGGLDRYIYELAYSLAALADQVELCGVGFPDQGTNAAVRLTNLADPTASLWQRLWQVRDRYKNRDKNRGQSRDLSSRQSSRKIDAINLHFALYGLPLLGQLPVGVPVTCHFHGPWALESDKEGASKLGIAIKRQIEQRVYRRCDRFIVLSRAFGQILHEQYQVPWQKIHIIPGGVNTDQFQMTLERSQARAQLDWPQDRFILFTPRRLVHRMGIDNLLEALAELKQTTPEIWLAIAGKGPLRSQLEAQVQAAGLGDHVRFLGFLPEEDLPVAYQAADLTVMPSQSLEGFGLVLLESLACGTPAVCTPVGGMPEVLTDLSSDLIMKGADTDSIVQMLRQVVTREVELPDRATCCDYATQNFGWLRIAQRVRDVLLMPVS